MFDKLQNLIAEAGPEVVLEISEAGIAYSRPAEAKTGSTTSFVSFEPQTVRVSPVEENIVRPDVFLRAVKEAAGPENPRRRKRAALLVPDYAVRIAVLDFDSFPEDPAEQLSLVRFRMKKSVPFDADAAAVSYQLQKRGSKVDVLVAMGAMEILAKYEAPLRAAGLHPGLVLPSSLAALELLPRTGGQMLVRLNGTTLTLAVLDDGQLRLVRCLSVGGPADVGEIVFPTLTFLEEEWKLPLQTIWLCGLPGLPEAAGANLQELRGTLGAATPANAGLLGFLAGGLH